MSNRTNLVIALALLLGVSVVPLQAAESPKVVVDIIDEQGRVFPLYGAGLEKEAHTYRQYLEAVQGKAYAIRVKNRSNARLGLVIAVDGRNIISGKKSELKASERMYILGPWQSASYEGWRASEALINKFYFTDVKDSYAGAWGDHSAMGVIALAVFDEKTRYRPVPRYDRPRVAEKKSRAGEMDSLAESAMPGRILNEDSTQAGTGYGEEKYSHARLVHFSPVSRAKEKHFLKYEWRSALCQLGVLLCVQPEPNRFWPETITQRGFVPPPPGK